MDSYTIFGCTIAIILILLIIRKLNTPIMEKDAIMLTKKGNNIIIVSHEGEIPITKKKLVNLLLQFKENIEQAIPYVDAYNSYELQNPTDKAKVSLQEWINKQKDPVFILTKEKSALQEENVIENERDQLRKNNVSINDLMYNSKKETEAPVEDEKDTNTIGEIRASPSNTRGTMHSLAQNLQVVIGTICENNTCLLVDILNIKPFEKLMNKIKKNITTQNKHSNNVNHNLNNFIMVGRDNSTLMDCYKGECGLTSDSVDSSSMIVEKNRMVNNRFPYISTKYDNTNLNRFSTIVR